jgi:hypothetical protein
MALFDTSGSPFGTISIATTGLERRFELLESGLKSRSELAVTKSFVCLRSIAQGQLEPGIQAVVFRSNC